MVRDETARYGPFGGLRVERVTKDDGRYVLYYTWPEGPEEGAATAADSPDSPDRFSASPARRDQAAGGPRSGQPGEPGKHSGGDGSVV